jgi:cysteine-S-conjugate beta-lyase
MDFDSPIDRGGSHSLKWDNPKNAPGLPDILPFWVADMDFPSPPAVLEAIALRAEHPVFGYTTQDPEYAEEAIGWYRRRLGIALEREELFVAPGMMASIAAALRSCTEAGDGVIVMPPVYYPFFSIVEGNDRVPVETPLARGAGGAWEMDFDRLEAAAMGELPAGTKIRALLISSPHNPVGRVWSEAELGSLLEFCHRHGLALICDEIHGDLVYAPRRFYSMASFSGDDARGLFVLAGPNKTFNIAGLHISQAIARREAERRALARALSAGGFSQSNLISLAAGIAAYRYGEAWLDELLPYLAANRDYLAAFVRSELPSSTMAEVEGSYLAWIDFGPTISALGLRGEAELASGLEAEARIRLSPGGSFGRGGEGYLRFNFACPRAQLEEGLRRLKGYLKAQASSH